jgi:Fungal Zn(2)-Cys(6) binuclear cluster domain
MESDIASTPSPSSCSPAASSCDAPSALHFCIFCDKPFTKGTYRQSLNEAYTSLTTHAADSSYNRHLSYCRRAQRRPRVRARSCQACSVAKTKCSFHPRCSRCTVKGLKCVYDGRKAIFETPAEDRMAVPASAASSADRVLSNNLNTQIQVDPDTLGLLVSDVNSHDPACAPSHPWESLIFDQNIDNSLLFEGMDIAALSDNQCLETVPRSACTTRDDSLQALSAPASLIPQPKLAFLARLRMPDPVSQYSAILVVQTLRALPQMMLRRQTFPPFIHPHWHHSSTATRTAVPEPLANCMSVAHIFASLTSETKPFLWRTIRAEQCRFIDEVRLQFPF